MDPHTSADHITIQSGSSLAPVITATHPDHLAMADHVVLRTCDIVSSGDICDDVGQPPQRLAATYVLAESLIEHVTRVYTCSVLLLGRVVCHICKPEPLSKCASEQNSLEEPDALLPPSDHIEGIGGVVEINKARYGCRRGDRLEVVGESAKLWKLVGKKTIPKEHEGAGWHWVHETEQASKLIKMAEEPSHHETRKGDVSTACVGGFVGHVIDGALDENFMTALDNIRLSLPLDTTKKKTAAARRFFHDSSGSLCAQLEHALAGALPPSREGVAPRVFSYMRFLEYHEVEGALPPHTDALVRCKDSGRWSTHTLIVFASDCSHGGDTVMLPSCMAGSTVACSCGNDKSGEGFAARPIRGRIFLFPHQCLHEGRPTVVVPKILLRAEVMWTNAMCGR